MTKKRALSLPRRLAFAALAGLLFFAGLEGALRIAGEVVLRRHRARSAQVAERAGERFVLWAVGDSYTFGVGADDPARESFPRVAADLLAERLSVPVELVNLGRPGQNSTRIAESLAQAAEAGGEPDAVLVLAGVNNTRWLGQSGQFCLEEGTPAAPGGLRGLRTYKLLAAAVLSVRPPRAEDLACRAVADGFRHLDEGYPDRALAAFEEARAGAPRGRWARLGAGLALARMGRHGAASEEFDAAADPGWDPPPALALARGFSLRAAGRSEEAAAIAAGAHPGDLADVAELLRAWALYDAGRPAEALARFDVLGGLRRDPAGPPRGGLEPYGLDGRGWSLLALGRPEEAAEAFDRANESGRAVHVAPHLLGWSHLGRAIVAHRRTDSARALAELEEAARDSSAVAAARAVEGWVRGASDCRDAAAAFTAALAVVADQPLALEGRRRCAEADRLPGELPREPALSPAPTVSMQQWIDPADTRLVRRDLRRAAEIARGLGATPVFLTYPQPDAHPELAEAILAEARASAVPAVDPRPAFRARLQEGVPWDALLVPDGHPTTGGYALIGELVASRLVGDKPGEQGGRTP